MPLNMHARNSLRIAAGTMAHSSEFDPIIMDIALQYLLPHIAATDDDKLLIADEHIDLSIANQLKSATALNAITNRCDVAAALQQNDIATALSDFEFGDLPAGSPSSFDAIFFRVAKEKALVHHAINRALEYLRPGGALWLAGEKNDGIKTYIEKAATRAQTSAQLERHGAVLVGAITKNAALLDALSDQHYAELREIKFDEKFSAWSKPGIFGWQKIDAGSAFLIDHLSMVWAQSPKRVLDLGCGYGYLTLMAARQWPNAHFVATDNNMAAISATSINVEKMQIDASVICSDAGASIREQFDAIICNPPFHSGFTHDSGLTDKFLRQMKRLLTRRGRALCVVNLFIPLEKMAKPLFSGVHVIANNKSFKLIMLEH